MYVQILEQTLKSCHKKCAYVLSSNIRSPVMVLVGGSLDVQTFPCEIGEVQRHAQIICTNLSVVLENLASTVFLNHPLKRSL